MNLIILTDNKKKIFKLIYFLSALVYILSLRYDVVSEISLPKYKTYINIILIIVTIFLLIHDSLILYKNLKKDNLSNIYWNIFFWCGWIFFSLLFLITLRSNYLTYLPLFYIYYSIIFAFFPLKIIITFAIVGILTQYLYLCVFPWERDYINFSLYLLMTVLFSFLGYFLKKERMEKRVYESKLMEIKESAKSFFAQDENSLVHVKAEKRIETLQNTFGFFEERVFRILQQIKELMEPYTVAFFKIKEDGKTFKILEAISDSDYLRYNDDISLEEGVIGWIYKHDKSLNFSSVKGGSRSLNYYDQDLPVASFLGIPVYWKEKIVGVLAVDSLQDNAFNMDSENIVKLAAIQIQEAIENTQLLQQTQQQFKEFYALYDGSKRLLKSVSLNDNLNSFLDIVGAITNFEVAAIALTEEFDSKILTVMAVRNIPENIIGSAVDSESLLAWVVNHKQYLDMRRFDSKKRTKPLINSKWKSSNLQRVILYPLMLEERVLGSFLLGFRNTGPDDYEKRILEILANQACIAISNAFLFEQVKRMATTDGLTGVYNHRYFQEKFTKILLRAERYGEKFSLMLLDIDFFKKVNDTYGHPVGDIVLKKVAEILSSIARKVDIVARYGGEEFAIICVNEDKKNALKLAERLRKEIEETVIIFEGGKLKVTASMGVASYPEDGIDKPSIIEKADKALYEAKHSGRNRVVLA